MCGFSRISWQLIKFVIFPLCLLLKETALNGKSKIKLALCENVEKQGRLWWVNITVWRRPLDKTSPIQDPEPNTNYERYAHACQRAQSHVSGFIDWPFRTAKEELFIYFGGRCKGWNVVGKSTFNYLCWYFQHVLHFYLVKTYKKMKEMVDRSGQYRPVVPVHPNGFAVTWAPVWKHSSGVSSATGHQCFCHKDQGPHHCHSCRTSTRLIV